MPGADDPRRTGPRGTPRGNIALGLIAATLAAGLLQSAVLADRTPLLIRGDGVGYYAYLRSALFDGDLNFRNEYEHFKVELDAAGLDAATSRYLQFPPTARGAVFNPWPPGPALLWLPFFLAGHLWALASGAPADGYSLPYQAGCALGSAFYGFAGLLLAWRICRARAGAPEATLAVATVYLASPLVAYQLFVPWMPHALGFFATALFLHLWLASRGRASRPGWALLGLSAGLCFLQRYQDLLIAAPVLAGWLKDAAAARGGAGTRLRAFLCPALPFCAGALAGAAPQLAAWQAIYGSALAFPHGEIGLSFAWDELHLGHTLFAPATGLFSSSPVLLAGAAGLLLVGASDALLGWGLLAVLAAEAGLVSAMPPHFQGSTFGARYFISLTPAFALGLAALAARARGRVPFAALAAAGSLLAAWNLLLLALWGLGMYDRLGLDVSWGQLLGAAARLPGRLLPHSP